jgi:hypothetical protein
MASQRQDGLDLVRGFEPETTDPPYFQEPLGTDDVGEWGAGIDVQIHHDHRTGEPESREPRRYAAERPATIEPGRVIRAAFI